MVCLLQNGRDRSGRPDIQTLIRQTSIPIAKNKTYAYTVDTNLDNKADKLLALSLWTVQLRIFPSEDPFASNENDCVLSYQSGASIRRGEKGDSSTPPVAPLEMPEARYFSKHARKSSLSGEEEALMRSLRR